jgi:hypothetical protein
MNICVDKKVNGKCGIHAKTKVTKVINTKPKEVKN